MVLGHCYRHSLQGEPSVIEEVIYSFHMPLFVLVSGYFGGKVPSYSVAGLTVYWRGRAERLLLPLLFLPSLCDLILSGRFSLIPLTGMTTYFWFTYALFLIFVVYQLAQLISGSIARWLARGESREARRERITLVLLLLSIPAVEAIITLIYHTPYSRIGNGLLLYKVAHLYKYFVLGHLLRAYPSLNDWARRESLGAVALLSYVILLYLRWHGVTFPGSETLLTLTALGFVYSGVHLAYRRAPQDRLWKPLAYLGTLSLPIYFVHNFFLPDMHWLRGIEASITHPFALQTFQALYGLILTAAIMFPTMLVVRVLRANHWVRYFVFGERR